MYEKKKFIAENFLKYQLFRKLDLKLVNQSCRNMKNIAENETISLSAAVG